MWRVPRENHVTFGLGTFSRLLRIVFLLSKPFFCHFCICFIFTFFFIPNCTLRNSLERKFDPCLVYSSSSQHDSNVTRKNVTWGCEGFFAKTGFWLTPTWPVEANFQGYQHFRASTSSHHQRVKYKRQQSYSCHSCICITFSTWQLPQRFFFPTRIDGKDVKAFFFWRFHEKWPSINDSCFCDKVRHVV